MSITHDHVAETEIDQNLLDLEVEDLSNIEDESQINLNIEDESSTNLDPILDESPNSYGFTWNLDPDDLEPFKQNV